jgi:hypothetical protein
MPMAPRALVVPTLRCTLGVLLSLAGCGGDRGNAATRPDAGGADAAPTDAGGAAPITAPADTWTWVDIAGTRCVHGTETGIGVNLHPGATKLLVFMQGGGSCTHCWGLTEDAKVGTPTHYGPGDFAIEPDIGQKAAHGQLLTRRDDPDNPLDDANLVFIPYCTGDAHAGAATVTETGDDGLAHQDTFWGATDTEIILRRLVATFPHPSRVWLAGSSAGGVATTFNFPRVRAAFGVRTDVINDSGEPITPGEPFATDDTAEANLWGIAPPAGCTTCTTALGYYQFNRGLDADSKFAILSHDYDPVIGASNFGTEAQNPDYLVDFHAALDTFIAGLDTSAHALTIANTPDTAVHVVMNKGYSAPVGAWLRLMVNDDPSWANTSVPTR